MGMILMCSAKGAAKSCPWGGITLCTSTVPWADQLGSSLAKMALQVPGGHQIEREPAMCLCGKEVPHPPVLH